MENSEHVGACMTLDRFSEMAPFERMSGESGRRGAGGGGGGHDFLG